MRPLQFAVLAFLLFAAAESLVAAACPSAPLSTYDAGSFTCTLGPYTMDNFAFNSGTFTDSSVSVTPVTTNGNYGFTFTFTGWSVGSGVNADSQIRYTYDAPPIGSLEEIMQDPINPPGITTLTTDVCLGGDFTGFTIGTCSTLTTSSFNIVATSSGTQSTSGQFTPSSILGIIQDIDLNGGAGGSADILGLTSQSLPEPGTFVSGLLALAFAIAKLRLKRL
jgi:hypothetical protein